MTRSSQADRADGVEILQRLPGRPLARLRTFRADGLLEPRSVESREPGLIIVRLGIFAGQATVSGVQGNQLA